MNDRLETLLCKVKEAIHLAAMPWEFRAVLRQVFAELPLIRDQYERKIAELEEIIANAEQGENQ